MERRDGEMENSALIRIDDRDLVISREPTMVLEEAHKAAKALTEVINQKKRPVKIGGETYLEFEDWMLIGRFYGISVKVVNTKEILKEDEVIGYEARAVAILVRTGEEISAAEAMCLNDEKNWKDRPLFMLRSMSQTRACAKAFRNVLAWVVVLAGYKPTPAEEMDGVIVQDNGILPDMDAFHKRSEALCAELHDKLVASEDVRQLKAVWAKINQSRFDLLPEHFSILENLKNELKGKMEVRHE
jgi:hypothetical protein